MSIAEAASHCDQKDPPAASVIVFGVLPDVIRNSSARPFVIFIFVPASPQAS